MEADEATVAADLLELGLADDPTEPQHPPESPDDQLIEEIASIEPARFDWGRRLPEVVALLAVLVLGLAIVLILADEDDEPPAAAPVTTVAAAPSRQAPAGPGSDPALIDPAIALSFDGADGPLPSPFDSAEWRVVAGRMDVLGGRVVSGGDEPLGSLVVFEPPTADFRAQVTLPQVKAGAGLVFRGDDTQRWAWVVAPAFSTVNLYRIDGAGQTVVQNSGVTLVEPGMTIGVNLVGSRAELLANGAVVATVENVGTGLDFGLVALTPETAAEFDDLLVAPA